MVSHEDQQEFLNRMALVWWEKFQERPEARWTFAVDESMGLGAQMLKLPIPTEHNGTKFYFDGKVYELLEAVDEVRGFIDEDAIMNVLWYKLPEKHPSYRGKVLTSQLWDKYEQVVHDMMLKQARAFMNAARALRKLEKTNVWSRPVDHVIHRYNVLKREEETYPGLEAATSEKMPDVHSLYNIMD